MSDTPVPDPDDVPDDDDDEVDVPAQQVTTTKTKDYLNRSLVNASPGVSAATDYLGRNVRSGDLDYMGRALVA